jgi:CBS domain-containing protein
MKNVHNVLEEKHSRDVYSISPDATVYDALRLMQEKDVGALVVMSDQEKVAGIISERDYARGVTLQGKTSKKTPVQDIMTPIAKMFTVTPDKTVDDCMVLMTAKHVRHLPVFEGDTFIGLISIGDVVKSIIAEKELLIEQLSNYITGKYPA